MTKKNSVHPRSGMDVESFRQDITEHLRYTLAKDQFSTTQWDNYKSVVLSVMDRLHDRWINTQQSYYDNGTKRVYYISMEYLIGRLLDNMLVNLGLQDVAAEAMEEVGLDYDKVREAEWDAGLGNGGLGRLAACFLPWVTAFVTTTEFFTRRLKMVFRLKSQICGFATGIHGV
jgi:glycogen phosphorylase